MRSPRVVGDYHVDRREVQVQRCTEPTRTNSPITFVSSFRSSLSRHTGSRLGVPETQSGGDAAGPHLFPFRTEKLSPQAPMVLPGRVGEQAAAAFGGRRRTGVWLLPAAAAPSFFARPPSPFSFSFLLSFPSLRPRKPEANARVASTCFLEGKSTADPLGTLLQGMPVCFLHGKSTYCRQPFMQGNVVLQHFADNNFSDEARKTAKTFQKKISCGHAAIG